MNFTMRSMKLKYAGRNIYSSQFDTKTGVLARVVEVPDNEYSTRHWDWGWDAEFEKRYHDRGIGTDGAFSPVPETVDISITDKCGFGCSYCYQDSRPEREHGPKELVETVLRGFDEPPYQIAIGGGEPTIHPDFEHILRTARAIGTVPNYTTAGHYMTDSIARATNEVCGGVAMTYHAFKGIDWFVKHYVSLKEQLTVQLNVHVIADASVAKNLRDLLGRVKDTGPLRLVLLAYYPDVGRASLESLMAKRVYTQDLPAAIKEVMSAGYQLAFSEGMLPYFLSRPSIGVSTRFAMRSEGIFSCYFDPAGRCSTSSFETAGFYQKDKTAFTERSQALWEALWPRNRPGGDACSGCELRQKCSVPSEFHYAICAFAPHNAAPLKSVADAPKE